MKKFYSLMAAVLSLFAANAIEVTSPESFFYTDFEDVTSDNLPRTWYTYGVNARPNDSYGFFTQGGDAYLILGYNNRTWAVSTSSFYPVVQADQWMITPEINIKGDNAIVTFDILTLGSSISGSFDIYVAESTATTPNEFRKAEPIYSATKRGNTVSNAIVPIVGFKDKSVRLAFVNTSTNAGYLGFTNIKVSPYEITVNDYTNNFVSKATDINIDMDVVITTPVACEGFTAKLVASNGQILEFTTTENLQSGNAVTVVYPEKIRVSDEVPVVEYEITITPNYEGAPSTTVKGEVVCSLTYDNAVVMEEFTGSWCGYCPSGIAAMNKYADEFGNRFYGIAIHDDDEMSDATFYYENGLAYDAGVDGLPSAYFNREILTTPYNEKAAKKFYHSEATCNVSVDRVTYIPDESNRVTVDYSIVNGYSISNHPINVAVILTEDKVGGEGQNWMQTNYFQGYTEAEISQMLGADWWPYMKDICNKSYMYSLKYDDVARGAYPTYEGKKLSEEWERNVWQSDKIEFDMPSVIQDWNNTHIIVLAIDSKTGKILNARGVDAVDYNKNTGVAAALENGADIKKIGSTICVNALEGQTIQIYGVDGRLLGSYRSNGGETVIDGSSFSGLIIVRVASENGSVSKKFIW